MPRVLEAETILYSRYRIIELVAQGGMGAVYRADDLRLSGRQCAIKEIIYQEDALVDADDAREQFYREASTLARLDHPNLPKVSDHFSENNRDYLVMDFVPGPDLQTVVLQYKERGLHLPERQVLEWAGQLCDALEYLHSQKPPILHRDVKPANIRLTASGMVKLVDFGLVKLLTADEVATVTVVHAKGTASYTPLEQYGGETGHTDTRSDIYGLGATLYHLLTGQAPPSAKDRFLHPGVITPPQEINPRISERSDRAVLWALAMHPDERPASIQDFRRVLLQEGALPKGNASNCDCIEESWGEALRINLPLLALALLLLFLAAYISG